MLAPILSGRLHDLLKENLNLLFKGKIYFTQLFFDEREFK